MTSMATVKDSFQSFASLGYAEQAKSFLNAYFLEDRVQDAVEDIWDYVNYFVEIDDVQGKEGSSIDAFGVHRFFEKVGETVTVTELRETLRLAGLDFKKRFSLIEYLLFKFKYPVEDFVKRPQGDNNKEITEAQEKLEMVQRALEIANKAASDARQSAQAAALAEEEQRAALEEVEKEECIRDERTKELEARSNDENIGLVARNRAKNELAQHLGEDSTPLMKAKLTLKAATKRAEKARVKADELLNEADIQSHEMESKLEEAQKYLNDLKLNSGSGGQGSLWWLQRELDEKKKYLPKKRQIEK